ncbi:MAG TPA: bifunctional nuclease family protein [Leptospiraceae bacterium]|nr:bifunctional nuclease family protein [Leptospiraceae bacterium]
MLEVTISDVSITNVGFAIFLKPTNSASNKVVPIFIGPLETYSISSALDGIAPPRPNTHDLILSMLNEMDAKIVHVIINDIIGNIFYARIVIQLGDGVVELDARPSDSVAIAIRAKCPIFMNEKVYNEAAVLIGEENTEAQESQKAGLEGEVSAESSTELEKMKAQLQKAVDEENFEEAAQLRDRIKKMVQEN